MKTVIILLYSLILTQSFAQEVNILNQATIGGLNTDFGMCSIRNSDGSFLLVGSSNSDISGEKTLNSYGDYDLWVVKVNSDFTIDWQNVYGGNAAESQPVAIATSDGGYLIGCNSWSDISGNKSLNNFGLADYWVLKLDSNGSIEWQNVYGGSSGESIVALQELVTGDFLVGGLSASSISGNKTENSKGFSDYWVLRIDENGNPIWDKTIGGSGVDNLTDLKVDANQDILLSGVSFSNISGDKSENNFGDEDYWIVKLNQSGNLIWDKTFGGTILDAEPKIITATNGSYIFGYSGSGIGGLKTEPSKGGIDIWVIKLDHSGNLLWDKTIGGNANDSAPSAILTQDNQILFGAISVSNVSGDKSENAINNSTDFWLVSIDTNGNVLWDKTIGGDNSDVMHSIHEKSDNNYVLFGYSDSNISVDKDENSRGVEDYWILEISSNVGMSENLISDIFIYPNPANNGFIINGQVQNLFIYNMEGKILRYQDEYNGELLTAENLPKGIYVVKFYHEGNSYIKKLIIN